MNISIFDVIGPVMVGPSSSHTAGAVKLARIAALISGKPFYRVTFALHGSFAKTGVGHGTDRALLAGAMGLDEDNEMIKNAYELAESRGLEYEFFEKDLGDVHENSCEMTFLHDDGSKSVIAGSSIGGGRILITGIDGVKTDISAEQPTLLIRQFDRKGVIHRITKALLDCGINIGVMRLTREERGNIATTVIETDDFLPPELAETIQAIENIISVRIIES